MVRGPTYKVGAHEMWMLETDQKICEALKRNRFWEPDVAALIEKYANPEWSFLDLGAHVGSFTLLAAGLYRSVIAVEANPAAYEILAKNVDYNELRNVETHNVAVWDHDGGVAFVPQVQNSGSSWVDARGQKANAVTVPSTTLRQILGSRRPEVWKVDIEGAEHRALGDIEEYRPKVILLEYSAGQLERTSEASGEDLYHLLGAYDWFEMNGTQVWFDDLPPGGYENFLLIRRH